MSSLTLQQGWLLYRLGHRPGDIDGEMIQQQGWLLLRSDDD